MVSYDNFNSSATMKSAVKEGLYPPFLHATVRQPLCCTGFRSLEFSILGTNLNEPKFTIPVEEVDVQLPGKSHSRYTSLRFMCCNSSTCISICWSSKKMLFDIPCIINFLVVQNFAATLSIYTRL